MSLITRVLCSFCVVPCRTRPGGKLSASKPGERFLPQRPSRRGAPRGGMLLQACKVSKDRKNVVCMGTGCAGHAGGNPKANVSAGAGAEVGRHGRVPGGSSPSLGARRGGMRGHQPVMTNMKCVQVLAQADRRLPRPSLRGAQSLSTTPVSLYFCFKFKVGHKINYANSSVQVTFL